MAYDKKITLKVDVSKIDKDQLYQGEKGVYLTLTVIPTPDSQWNDYMVTQYRGKELDSVILGNGKDLRFSNAPATSAPTPTGMDVDPDPSSGDEDDLPF